MMVRQQTESIQTILNISDQYSGKNVATQNTGLYNLFTNKEVTNVG
jgi:hypothetical protein